MKKRILSAALTLCFLLALVPHCAAAAGETMIGPLRQIAIGYEIGNGDDYAVIDADGALWTWGANGSGQLGDGTTEARFAPVKILDHAASVSLGWKHSAAILTDGSLWMWGANNCGQLGDGTTVNRTTPVKIMDNVSCVSLGWGHSAAILADGSLWTWGWNKSGQLGDGTTENRLSPVKILDHAASISVGSDHCAAVLTDSCLWMWGYNIHGQLGDGTTTNSTTPVKILDAVSAVSLGNTQSAAILPDGSLWMWGWNSYGQLGDGTTTSRTKPVKILNGAASVSVGPYHSATVLTDGSLWMWGGNYYTDTKEAIYYSNVPVKISDSVLLAAAGHTSGLFLSEAQELWQYAADSIPPVASEIEFEYKSGIYLGADRFTLAVNMRKTLQTAIYPPGDRDSALAWVSSNRDVAAVEDGVVTALSAGEADITVIAAKTGDTAVCHVTVPEPLSLDHDAVTLRAGETCQLTPAVRRADGEETGVAWFSSAPDVASVTDGGLVTALTGGTATVSAVTQDGAYRADCVITVPYEAAGITLDRDSLTMKPGGSVTLTAFVTPEEAVEKGVRWLSTAPGVATVADGLVKAWSLGKTTITAVTVSGGFTASCVVNVTEDGVEPASYTITFHPNGGTVSQPSKILTDADAVYGALPVPDREGYDFAGWFTATDYGTRIQTDTPFTEKRNQTLYAVWTERTERYTVTLEGNGGTVVPESVTVTAGGVYGKLPVPERKGCEFLGWFTEPSGGEQIVPDTPVTLTENRTLYAHWTATNVPLISLNGQAVTDAEEIPAEKDVELDGLLVVADAENPGDFQTASAFCAVYDAEGKLAHLQVWEVDVTDLRNICFTGSVHIPEGVSVSTIKIIILSKDLVPLRLPGALS